MKIKALLKKGMTADMYGQTARGSGKNMKLKGNKT